MEQESRILGVRMMPGTGTLRHKCMHMPYSVSIGMMVVMLVMKMMMMKMMMMQMKMMMLTRTGCGICAYMCEFRRRPPQGSGEPG